MTPEGRVKRRISELLSSYSGVYYFMPVPSGYGESSLDYVGCYRGLFFAIEAKRPGKEPTKRQGQIRATMERAGAKVFKISCDAELAAFKQWMDARTCLSLSTSPAPTASSAHPPTPSSSI